MSAEQTGKGVKFEYGFAENLDIIVSYTCPNCQKKNEVNLSAHKEGDRIPCASCGFMV